MYLGSSHLNSTASSRIGKRMLNILTQVFIPFLTNITSDILAVFIEHRVLTDDSIDYKGISKKNRHDWASASAHAIKRFRKQQPGYTGVLCRRSIKIEAEHVKRGHADMQIAVSKRRFFWKNLTGVSPIDERFELTIDRTGDILRIDQLPVDENGESRQPISKRHTTPEADSAKSGPSPSAAYLYVLVLLLGWVGGFASGALIYYAATWQEWPQDDIFFWGVSVISALTGMAVAVAADVHFRMDQASAWQRLPLSVILGIIGGPIGILLSCIVIIIVLLVTDLVSDHQGTGANRAEAGSRESTFSRYRREGLLGKRHDSNQ